MPGPRWRGWPELPKDEEERPTATLTYVQAQTGKRQRLPVMGRDSRDIDRNIQSAIANIRAGGHRMVKTEMTVKGEEWVYEYNVMTGQIEHVFLNGEIAP